MKIKTTFLIAILIMATVSARVCAEDAYEFDDDEGVKTVVTVSYWDGRLSFGDERTSQRHLPVLATQIAFNDTWRANLEYSNAKESNTEPSGYSFDKTYALVGMQYVFRDEYFATFSWQRIDYNLTGGTLPYGMVFSGVRLGAGYDFTRWLAEDWTGTLEFGAGISNNVEVAYANGTEKEDCDTTDAKVEVRYLIFKNVTAVGGYKYLKTRANVLAVPYSFDVKGAYLGVGYEF